MNPISQRMEAIREMDEELRRKEPNDAVILACQIVIRLTDNIKFGWMPANEF